MGSTKLTALIDDALAQFGGRGLISGDEIVDFLLDLRSVATADDLAAFAELDDVAPVPTA